MKILTIVGALAAMLGATTASADIVLPGFANGVPDPLTDGGIWYFDYGRLEARNLPDSQYHYFDISIPVKNSSFSQTISVTWRHNVHDCGTPCLMTGVAQAAVLVFDADGALHNTPVFNGDLGDQGVSLLPVPPGGSVMLQIRMKYLNGNNHYFSRVTTSGQLSL